MIVGIQYFNKVVALECQAVQQVDQQHQQSKLHKVGDLTPT
jgi:hypothetical protein